MSSNPFAGQSIAGLYDNALKQAASIAGTKLTNDTSRANNKAKNFTDTLNQGIVTANNAIQGQANRKAEAQMQAMLQDRADQRIGLQESAKIASELKIYEGKAALDNKMQLEKLAKLQDALSGSALDDSEATHFNNTISDREILTSSDAGKKQYAKGMAAFQTADNNVSQAISYSKRLQGLYEEVDKAGGTLKITPPNTGKAIVGRLFGGDNSMDLQANIDENNIIMANGKLSPERSNQIKADIISMQNQIRASMAGINRNIFQQVGTQTALDFDIGLRSILTPGNSIGVLRSNLATGIDRFEAGSATGNLYYGNTGKFKLRMDNLHERQVTLDNTGTPQSHQNPNNPMPELSKQWQNDMSVVGSEAPASGFAATMAPSQPVQVTPAPTQDLNASLAQYGLPANPIFNDGNTEIPPGSNVAPQAPGLMPTDTTQEDLTYSSQPLMGAPTDSSLQPATSAPDMNSVVEGLMQQAQQYIGQPDPHRDAVMEIFNRLKK